MTILITGASRGIGAQLALELAKEKYKLVLLSRNEDGLNKVCSECNELAGEKVASYMVYDLKDLERSKEDFVTQLKEHTSELNCLVNNAGALI